MEKVKFVDPIVTLYPLKPVNILTGSVDPHSQELERDP